MLAYSSIRECAEICNGVTSGFTFGSIAEYEIGHCEEDGCVCNCAQIEQCDVTNRTSNPLYQLSHPDRGNIRVTKTLNTFSFSISEEKLSNSIFVLVQSTTNTIVQTGGVTVTLQQKETTGGIIQVRTGIVVIAKRNVILIQTVAAWSVEPHIALGGKSESAHC